MQLWLVRSLGAGYHRQAANTGDLMCASSSTSRAMPLHAPAVCRCSGEVSAQRPRLAGLLLWSAVATVAFQFAFHANQPLAFLGNPCSTHAVYVWPAHTLCGVFKHIYASLAVVLGTSEGLATCQPLRPFLHVTTGRTTLGRLLHKAVPGAASSDRQAGSLEAADEALSRYTSRGPKMPVKVLADKVVLAAPCTWLSWHPAAAAAAGTMHGPCHAALPSCDA